MYQLIRLHSDIEFHADLIRLKPLEVVELALNQCSRHKMVFSRGHARQDHVRAAVQMYEYKSVIATAQRIAITALQSRAGEHIAFTTLGRFPDFSLK